jgi:CRISPR-associated protein Csd1
MSWLAKLYETYEAGFVLDLPEEEKLMPISHTLQNAHIKIVIDGAGNFLRASVLEKTRVVLPATEKSAGRSSGEAPHPLADKLQYVAKDYLAFGGRKKPYFSSYEGQLGRWCNSPYAHSKAVAVYNYIKKGKVVADLIQSKVLHIGHDGKLLAYWPFDIDSDNPLPPIFKVLPPLPKTKRLESDKPEIEPGDALICWQVEKIGDLQSETWTDTSLQESWIQFQSAEGGDAGLCFVTGKERVLATNHPAKLRHTGDKAKLLSANDSSGFTFRGRFTEGDGSQAAGVAYEVTQKAHNALRWLIDRQGFRNGDQVYVAWAVSGKPIPDPLQSTFALLDQPLVFRKPLEEEPAETIDHTADLGASFAHKFNNYLRGYRAELEPNEQIVIMGLDSATPGRMSIIYYRALLASEFLERLESWHLQFAWPQRHSVEIKNGGKRKKSQKKIIWPVSSPVPRIIAEAAYGDMLKSNETLKKNLLERIIPAIVDGQPFPRDIMLSAIRSACNRNSCEPWEWERNMGVACALYRGFYRRQPEQQRREYSMSLEENRNTRDYLYGRLLAIAERIEEVALSVGGENRPTTSARLMQRFADRPFSTWRNISLALQPYMQRLQGNRPGFLTNRKKELDAVVSSFEHGEFEHDKSLSGEFLLGYHCQRITYRQKNNDEANGIK